MLNRDAEIQEVLYNKALDGQRASFALAELKDFLMEEQNFMHNRMEQADTQEEAWQAALEYKALSKFITRCESHIVAGMEANKRLKET